MDNYIAVLDPILPGGGPTGPIPGPVLERQKSKEELAEGRGRVYRIVSTTGSRGEEIIVTIELDAKGNETGMSFTIGFDPAKLSFRAIGGTNNNPDVTDASGSPVGMNRTLNATRAYEGRLGLLLDSNSRFEAGTRQILHLRFYVLSDAVPGATMLTFEDDSIVRSTTDANARYLAAIFENGEIIIKGPRRGNEISWMSPTSQVWPAF